jgi:polyphenol oxidase
MLEKSTNLSFIRHGFFGRAEGVSEGIYKGLNCGAGSGDNKLHVQKNKEIVCKAIGAKRLVTLHQVHGREVLVINSENDIPTNGFNGDAIVSRVPEIAIGILTADCAPILFSCEKTGIIGAAHAGWKGAVAGVAEACIEQMQELGAKEIKTAIGPCIKQSSYEVDTKFYDNFMSESTENAKFFSAAVIARNPQDDDAIHLEKQVGLPRHFVPRNDESQKYHFDLSGYINFRLIKAGISDVWVSQEDTYSLEEKYFSFRRTTHRGEPDYGRQISVIMAKG